MISNKLIEKLTRTLCGLSVCATTLTVVFPAAAEEVRALPQETPEEAQRMADSLFVGRFAIDDKDPERSVPSPEARDKAPLDFATLLMELGERAERATNRGDHRAAAKYYAAVAKAVPGSSAPFARACTEYEAAGDRANALTACADALAREGVTVADFSHYAKLVLADPNPLSEQRIKDLDSIAQHLEQATPDSLIPAQLRCDIGVRLLDVARLTECTTVLHLRAPEEAKTLSYQWVLAMQRQDYRAAMLIVKRAKLSTMSADAVQAMENTTASFSARPRSGLDQLRERPLLGAIVITFVLLAMMAFVLYRRRPRVPALSISFLGLGGKASTQSTQEP